VLLAESSICSIQSRLRWGGRLPLNTNCSGIDWCSHMVVRPLPFSTPCSQVIEKLSDRRSLFRIATRRWASVRSSISISREEEL
jgi:hypothetical protein